MIYPQRFIAVFFCLSVTFTPPILGYRSTVRHTELVNELELRGLPLPTGVGVTITQVEAPDVNGGYGPNASDGEFVGKVITQQSELGLPSSGHASTVGRNLYGNSTSIAPGITNIDVHEAEDWQDDWVIGSFFNEIPPVESNDLQNHSWVDFSSGGEAPERMDFAVERDGFLPIAGLYNSDFGNQVIPTDIPETYGSIYNGIAVGVSDGTHRTGVTEGTYGPGRVKPEIVAPNNFTSFATPYVTAAAAVLIEVAGSDTNAKRPQVLKAVLLAGANKSPFANWDQTVTRPIDDVFGAGQLDIYEAYFIQAAGEQDSGSTIEARGWDFGSITNSSMPTYTVEVPEGFELRNLSILVTWNRTVRTIGQRLSANTLPNLALRLEDTSDNSLIQQSNSNADNLEHIWRDETNALAEGTYRIELSSDRSADYAIAWRSELYQNYELWQTVAFSGATLPAEQDFDDDPDKDGVENGLEQAFGGDPEVSDPQNLPVQQLVEDEGQTFAEISFRRPQFENELTYTVETVDDLGGVWSSASSDVELVSISDEGDGFDRYTYRRIDPVSTDDTAFLRVSVSQ